MLTIVQKKILKLLAINCRYTNKDIAKAISTSEDTVRYQTEKLIGREMLSQFVATFDYKKIGFDYYHYLIRVRDVNDLPIPDLVSIPEISFINTCHGSYDIQLLVLGRTDEEILRVKSRVDALLGDRIVRSMFLRFFTQLKFTNVLPVFDIPVRSPRNQKNPVYALGQEEWHSPQRLLERTPDFTAGEFKTIRELLHDPRAAYMHIGRKTGQSYETVRQQIIKLASSRQLANFGLYHDFRKYGYFANFFLLSIQNPDWKAISAYLGMHKNIFYAAELIGTYNLIIYVVAQTPEEFQAQSRALRTQFKDNLLDIEMLSFNELHKSTQFPMALLEEAK